MNHIEAMRKMNLPRDLRGPRRIFQVWVTRACDKSCHHCTQASNMILPKEHITPEQFETILTSMDDYPGVVAMFGGNPCVHPQFEELCEIMIRHIPYGRRGIWTNRLLGKGKICQQTFNPRMSNFNVHMDSNAVAEFVQDWPETRDMLKGQEHDCGHSPIFGEPTALGVDPDEMWDMISVCDINQKWSAMAGVFRGEPRGWFCEIAGAQSMVMQYDPNYPDTGVPITKGWWKDGLDSFGRQIMFHCPKCLVPLRGKGQGAVKGVKDQVTSYYGHLKPKRGELEVLQPNQSIGHVPHVTDYLANSRYQDE